MGREKADAVWLARAIGPVFKSETPQHVTYQTDVLTHTSAVDLTEILYTRHCAPHTNRASELHRDPPPTVRQREHAYKIGAKASLFLRPRSQNRSQLRGVRDLCKFGQPDGGSITSELCVREISRLA